MYISLARNHQIYSVFNNHYSTALSSACSSARGQFSEAGAWQGSGLTSPRRLRSLSGVWSRFQPTIPHRITRNGIPTEFLVFCGVCAGCYHVHAQRTAPMWRRCAKRQASATSASQYLKPSRNFYSKAFFELFFETGAFHDFIPGFRKP